MGQKTLTENEIRILNKTLRIITDLYSDNIIPRKEISHKSLNPKYQLSDREIRIIQLICDEFTNEEIAKKLKLGKRTIEGLREVIMGKTKAKNVIGLFKYALRNRIYILK
jgi:DNA-binding NarL/FixJ family response regulator